MVEVEESLAAILSTPEEEEGEEEEMVVGASRRSEDSTEVLRIEQDVVEVAEAPVSVEDAEDDAVTALLKGSLGRSDADVDALMKGSLGRSDRVEGESAVWMK